MLDLTAITLLCPCNDLESKTILEIAKEKGLNFYKIEGSWGLTLENALKQIDLTQLRPHVLIVEMPDKSEGQIYIKQLEQLGKTLHIIDHHLYDDQTQLVSSLSSLEQFAQLIDYKLTEEQIKIAINDRDFLMGLSQAQVPWGEAYCLRRKEWELQDKSKLMSEAFEYLEKNVRDLENVRLVLAPEKFSSVMLEAAQFPTEKKYNESLEYKKVISLKNVMVIYCDDNNPKNISQIEFAGSAKYKSALEQLRTQGKWEKDFITWQGGGELGCFFGAIPRHKLANINELVSQLLDICLHYGRPLRHYGCTFYLPLDLFSEEELEANKLLNLYAIKPEYVESYQIDIDKPVSLEEAKEDAPISKERQAYLYFLPHIRNLIFDIKNEPTKAEEPIKQDRLKRINDLKLKLILNTEKSKITTQVKDVSLFTYFNGLYVLTISVESDEKLGSKSSLVQDNDSWWHDLFFSSPEEFNKIKSLQLQNWLHFTNQARLIYASFYEQVKEGKLPNLELTWKEGDAEKSTSFLTKNEEISKTTSQLSGIIMHLLKYFFASTSIEKRLISLPLPDDRMFVSVAYGLSGTLPKTQFAKDEVKRLFSLALYVDHKNLVFSDCQEYAYDSEFTKNLLKQHTLSRWEENGTYSGCCSYANAYMGFGGFFSHVIAPSHVPFIYGRMLLVSLFYQMTLRHYNRRISHATEALSTQNKTENFRELRKKFILFTNNYWFREVTNQTQGIEVFELQTKNLGLEKEYALIKDEMERADEYAVTLQTKNFNKAAFWFALVTLFVTLFTVDGSDIFILNWLKAFKDTLGLSLSFIAVVWLVIWLKREFGSKK
ncbi:hypothetical protein BegalDRAFT_3068 [Beggiatoa alba B18LD]|uniref:Uncharacterized protein n=1 Tax=Beggiatoa alba B18LD TaxID=395493 RepID=I3CJV1_9GAMM|nr:hypothetical protein [Beggiatoa alba]EIJ43894.1 hypothetical protein BegalDRAFT_3068 [Beggiatoa alba B18LD]